MSRHRAGRSSRQPHSAHHGKARDLAVAQRDHRGAFGQRDPGRKERIPRLGKEAAVIGGQTVEADAARIDQSDTGRRLGRRRRAFMADIVPGQPEARLPVVTLLRHHAVEPDIASLEPRHAGAPHLNPVALSAHRRPGDVEAQEAKACAVLHDRDTELRLAVEAADQEGAEDRRRRRHGHRCCRGSSLRHWPRRPCAERRRRCRPRSRSSCGGAYSAALAVAVKKRFSGRGRPRFSRNVVPSYSVRKSPRRCSSGTTLSTKSSSPPGR